MRKGTRVAGVSGREKPIQSETGKGKESSCSKHVGKWGLRKELSAEVVADVPLPWGGAGSLGKQEWGVLSPKGQGKRMSTRTRGGQLSRESHPEAPMASVGGGSQATDSHQG